MKTYTHRLFCTACTGIVCYGTVDDVKGLHKPMYCGSCLKEQIPLEKNWILMDQNESKIVNDKYSIVTKKTIKK